MSPNLVRRLFAPPLDRLAFALGGRIARNRDAIMRATQPRSAKEAPAVVIQSPFTVRHPERTHLGRDVNVGPNSISKLMASYAGDWSRHPDGGHVEQSVDPELLIGERVIGHVGTQVTLCDRVTIGDEALFAANVSISDGSRALTRGDRPYAYQGIERIAPARVARSWGPWSETWLRSKRGEPTPHGGAGIPGVGQDEAHEESAA